MRSILRYTPINNFSTHKITQAVQNKLDSIKQQQNNNYLKYEQLFFKLYAVHLQRQNTLITNVKKIDTMCIMSDFPCKSIVQYFNTTAKSYSQDFVVQTFVRLSRAYKISQSDNSSSGDFSINRLFFTPAFENLIQQYKYGLRRQNAMSWNNAFLVAQCLIQIGYADYQVFSILLSMVQTRINKLERIETQIRPFQIQKKDYYVKRNRFTQQNLASDQQFQTVYKMLNQKVKLHQQKMKTKSVLQEVRKQLSQDQQQKNLFHSIQQTVSMIQSFNNDINKLIQSIIVVRKQYRKMVQMSESKLILRNPELNLELLELQEILLSKKLISISDVKFNQRIDNQSLQLRRIQQILLTMIQPQEGLPVAFSSQIGQLLNKNLTDGQNKQTQNLNKLKEVAQYGKALSTLSKFCEVSRRLYNSPDARSLVSMKWQKTLLIWNKDGGESPQFKQNLHAQKIFRRTYADLYKMMKREYSIFMFTFIEAPLKYKIQFFQSLSRLGLHEQLTHLMLSQDTSRQKVQTYSNQQFASLIKVLNEVGSKINADHLKKSSLKYLKKLFENCEMQQNKSFFNMQFCTNSINFICQNFTTIAVDMASNLQNKDQIQVLYENLVNKLTNQVKYLEQSENFLTNDHLYQALRILQMQKSGQYKLNKSYLRKFNINIDDKKQMQEYFYKKNPFFSLSQQLVQTYAKSASPNNYPYVETGFNSKGELTAVLLCSSDQSSLDGKHANGNTNAYINRLKRQYNIVITPLSVNSLIDIDYEKIYQNKQFSFKSKQQIKSTLNKLFKRDQINLIKFLSIISHISTILQKHFKRNFMNGLIKFISTLTQSLKLFDRQKQILTYELFKFRRYRLYVQLDTLKQDYNLIDKTLKQQLQKLWRKQSSTVQVFKKHSSILQTIQNIQQNIILSVNNKNQQNKPLSNTLFEGKRFTIDSFIQNVSNMRSNIGIQFINTVGYVDKTFCPYKDWNQQIISNYPLNVIKLNESNNMTKILINKYLPLIKQQISILPYIKKQQLKNKKQFNKNSLKIQKQQNIKQLASSSSNISQQNQNSRSNLSQNMINNINSLLSFIHELKIQKTQQQLIQYIFSFDFIQKLLTNKSNDKNNHHSQLIIRKNQSYFQYLQMKNNKIYLQSPNLQYLFNKFQQKQQVYQVFNQRKQKRNLVFIQFQLGKLTRKQMYSKLESIDDQIINKIKSFQKDILDNVDQYKLFESGLKMIKIQQDQKQIQRVLNRTRYYDRHFDKDFIFVKGQKDRLIKIKRNKSQRILSLYKVLYKLSKNQQNQLNDHEKQVITKQANYIQYRLENQKDNPQVFSQKFTTLSVSDLSKADKQRLKLRGVDLSKVGNLALSDLILQLNNLLDIKVYQNFQKTIVKKYYSEKVGIPQEIFSSTLNKQFSKLAGEQQRAIINEHSKLDFYELGLLNQMVQTFKTQSKTGKQRFSRFYGTFYEDIQQMNDCLARTQLISEYLTQKELEYTDYYDPRQVNKLKEHEVMKLWNVIFKKPYKECETSQIQKMTNKICQRIRLMGDTPPAFFGLLVIKILQHPQTDLLTKQNLIANIEFFKVPLKLDSEDIRILGLQSSIQQKQNNGTKQELLEQMALASNKNFMENLNKKINMII